MPKLPRGALIRILFCLQVLSITFFSIYYPASVVHVLAAGQGDSIWLVLAGMCCLSCAGLVDTLINDLMPERFNFAWALKFRHSIFMLLAIGYAMVMSFVVEAGMWAAIPYFLINIVFIVVSAFTDVQRRFKNPVEVQKNDPKKENIHA